MKIRFLFITCILLFASCSTMGLVSPAWPARTHDPEMGLDDPKHLFSKEDIASIHEFVWREDPNRRIIGITAINRQTALVSCTYQSGDRFSRIEGFDLIRSGKSWKHGTYHARNVVQPM